MKNIALLIIFIIFFMPLYVMAQSQDSFLDIWISMNSNGKVEYSIGDGKKSSEEAVLKEAKRIYEIGKKWGTDLGAVHIIADKNVSMSELFRLCKIVKNGGHKDFVVSVFLRDIEGCSDHDSIEIKHMKLIYVEDPQLPEHPPKVDLPKETKPLPPKVE